MDGQRQKVRQIEKDEVGEKSYVRGKLFGVKKDLSLTMFLQFRNLKLMYDTYNLCRLTIII